MVVYDNGEIYSIEPSTIHTIRNLHINYDAFLARKLDWYCGELSNGFHYVIPELCQLISLLKVTDNI